MVSLRDVKRVLILLSWFFSMISNSKNSGSEKQKRESEYEKKQVISPLCRATVLALA